MVHVLEDTEFGLGRTIASFSAGHRQKPSVLRDVLCTFFDSLTCHFCILTFSPQSVKFFGRNGVCLICEFSYDFFIGGAVKWMGFWICTGVVVLNILHHVLIQIICLNFVAQAVCICT